jgi:hypothetical protein
VTKQNISDYTKQTKIKYRFAKQAYIDKIFELEVKERESLIQKINMNNTIDSSVIPQGVVNAIPRPLRIFPRDFTLKETELTLELNEEAKKAKSMLKTIEKRSLEEIIGSNIYQYDLSKKHSRRKNSIDINNIYTDIVKTESINLGKKFRPISKLDKEFSQLRNEEIFPLGIVIVNI